MTVMWFGEEGGVSEKTMDLARLCRVPGVAETEALALRVARLLARSAHVLSDPATPARELGWRYREGAIGANSSIESLLVPLQAGGFSIVINSRLAPTRDRAWWLGAHEIGHSFFYTSGSPPKRIIPVSAEEERFCDYFAQQLTRTLLQLGHQTAAA